MRMTNELANQLFQTLFAVAISANGGVELNKNGEPIIDKEMMSVCENYARDTFVEILESWEQFLGKEWEIEAE